MEDTILATIDSPCDLGRLAPEALELLAAEIRDELLRIVSRQGGHLASSLGVVELTIALLRTFSVPEDRIVWDTGHQAYVHKLLTGRRELMGSLRGDDGCCGFLNRDESEYDAFGAGHAGTAISAALGMAAARDHLGRDNRVVAVVGDGALACGSSLEGLNNVVEASDDFVLVLNDNRMSISPNVGALSQYLTRVIANERYNRWRQRLSDAVRRIPKYGATLRRMIKRLEEAAKSVVLPGVLFEEFGLRYIGPLDGHNLPQLLKTFRVVRRLKGPIVVHVMTEKGHGYQHAENSPEVFHGTGGFDVESGMCLASGTEPKTSFSDEFGQILCDLASEDERIHAITAGMCGGTGLKCFKDQFGTRFHDVGIAEEHAVVFAAGMATEGLRPVVALYATFMQRALDYVFHDVCLQRLPVVFCLDRAGIVPDGPTHHGILDLAFWRALPGLAVLQPADASDLKTMLAMAVERGEPAVIRYPRGSAATLDLPERAPLEWGRAEQLREGADVALWGVGREVVSALEVADRLADRGIAASVVNTRFFLPFDQEAMRTHLDRMPVVVIEDHCKEGGFGSLVRDTFADLPGARVLSLGWPREVIPWGTVPGIRAKYSMDVSALCDTVETFVRGDERCSD
ncbi:MAG: 1-deoxy-D-xylulose-5-phosphate synthase [Lentisphaeria bacterium]|nr:1-deoxy-D-xylulose-5-phosphate synthase [Lentisphaeria bacterium]